MKRALSILSAIAMGAFLAQCSPSATSTSAPAAAASPTNATGAPVGTVAPAFTGTTLDGKSISLADFKGKVVVLNFWATWCPPCRAETPDMVTSYGKLKAADVVFLGFDTSEAAPVVRTFVSIHGLPYTVALGKSADYNAYGVTAIPTTIVIDKNGIVRSRWVGGIAPARLASDVADARAGKNSTFATPEQKKIDALLAAGKVDAANKYIGTLTVDYDYDRTQNELGAAELKIANVQVASAKTTKQKLAAQDALANAYGDSNRWADAATIYLAALAAKPDSAPLTGAVAGAYYRLHDYPNMAKYAAQWVKLAPNDANAWDTAGLAQERAGNYADAVAPYEKAVALLKATADKTPPGKLGTAQVSVADESLDLADVYVALGDSKNAQRVFALSAAYAAKIPAGSPYNTFPARVAERTTEGMAAVAMAHGGGTNLNLAKWTGADLPGSVKTTLKYRLVVVGAPGSAVKLATTGLKPDWIASFCADGLCSPGGVTATLPAIGVKTYEFQLVPPTNGDQPGHVAVTADGAHETAIPG